jgi:predicted porin
LQQHRFYAGIHAAAQVFRITSLTYNVQEVVIRPWYVFAGYQFSPHLALQTGFLQHNPSRTEYSHSSINQAGQVVQGQGYADSYTGALPVLLRYRLARRPTRPLHLDALLGLTLVVHRYQANDLVTVGGKVQYQVLVDSRPKNLYLTGGFGVGYDLTPRVELMVEGTANRNTTAVKSAYARNIMFGVGTGLRYRFNIGK